jgi:hypothetical protein
VSENYSKNTTKEPRHACTAPHLSSGHEWSAVAVCVFLIKLPREQIPPG